MSGFFFWSTHLKRFWSQVRRSTVHSTRLGTGEGLIGVYLGRYSTSV